VKLLIILGLVLLVGLILYIGQNRSGRYRQSQSRAFHPSGGRRVSQIRPYPHSGWFVLAAVLVLVVAVLVVFS
jgi:hypothetical protein